MYGGGSGSASGSGSGSGSGASAVESIDPNKALRMQAALKTLGESEFRNFILYVKDGDEASNAALDRLNANLLLKVDTFVQDVDLLRVRPRWLTSVPVMVDKAKGVAHCGTAVHTIFSTNQCDAIAQVGRRMDKGRRMQFETGQPTLNLWGAHGDNAWDVRNTPADHTTGRAAAMNVRPVTSGKISQRDVDAFKQQSALIDDAVARRQPSGVRPG